MFAASNIFPFWYSEVRYLLCKRHVFIHIFFFIKEMGKMESKLKLVLVSHTAGALRLSGISY